MTTASEETRPDVTAPLGNAVVVDAALLVKVLLPEALSERAYRFFADAADAQRSVLVCPSVPIEVANVIHSHARRDEITLAEADTALRILGELGVVPEHRPGFEVAVVAFAREHRLRSLHDAQGPALAKLLSCECWTGHQTLYDSIAAGVPWLRWIGDYGSI